MRQEPWEILTGKNWAQEEGPGNVSEKDQKESKIMHQKE